MRKSFKKALSLLTAVAMSASLFNFSIASAAVTESTTLLEDAAVYPLNSKGNHNYEVPSGKRGVNDLVTHEVTLTRGLDINGTDSDGNTVNTYSATQTYQVNTVLRVGAWGTNQGVTLYGFNNYCFYTKGGNSVKITDIGVLAGEKYTLKVDYDLPAKMFRLTITALDDGKTLSTPWESMDYYDQLTDSWSQVGIYYINMMLATFVTGDDKGTSDVTETDATNALTMEAAKIYYDDGTETIMSDSTTYSSTDSNVAYSTYQPSSAYAKSEYLYLEYDVDIPTVTESYSTQGSFVMAVNFYYNNTTSFGGDLVKWNRFMAFTPSCASYNDSYALRFDSIGYTNGAGGTATMRIELDIPNGQYRLSIINPTTGASKTGPWESIPSTKSGSEVVNGDWAKVRFYYAQFAGRSVTWTKDGVSYTTATAVSNFELYYNTYHLRATAPVNGTITCDDAAFVYDKVQNSDTKVLTFTPDEGYEIGTVTANDVDITAELVDGVLTLTQFTEDIQIAATFVEEATEPDEGETTDANVNPTEPYTLNELGEAVYIRPEAATAGRDGILNLTLTRPEGASKGVYSIKAKIKENADAEATEAELAQFGNWKFTINGTEDLALTDLAINVGESATEFNAPMGLDIEIDFMRGQYRLKGYKQGTLSKTGAWYDLPHGFASYSEADIEEISIVQLAATAETLYTTLSNITWTNSPVDYINPEAAVVLDEAGETAWLIPESTTAGVNQIFSADVLLPTSDTNKNAFIINAEVTAGGETASGLLLYFDANRPSIDASNALKTEAGNSIWIHSSPKNSDGTTNLKLEFDWAAAKYRLISGNYHISAWLDLPFGFESYAYAVINNVSIAANNPVADDSATISNMSLSRAAVAYTNPTEAVTLSMTGDTVSYTPDEVTYGKSLEFSFDFTRASLSGNCTASSHKMFEIKAKLQSAEDEKEVTLFYYCRDRLLNSAGSTAMGASSEGGEFTNSIWMNNLMGASGTDASATIEFDMANGKYRFVGGPVETRITDWATLSADITDYSAYGLAEVSIVGLDVPSGDLTTISNAAFSGKKYTVTTTFVDGAGTVTTHGNTFAGGEYEEGTVLPLTITANDGYSISMVLVNGELAELDENGKLEITVTGDTEVMVIMEKIIITNPTDAVTLDDAGDDVYYTSEEAAAGKNMVFDMYFTRGINISGTWGNTQNYAIDITIEEDGEEITNTLLHITKDYIATPAAMADWDNSSEKSTFWGYNSGDYGAERRLVVTFDLATGTYKATIYEPDLVTPVNTISDIAIPGVTTPANAKVAKLRVYAVDTLPAGQTTTISSASLAAVKEVTTVTIDAVDSWNEGGNMYLGTWLWRLTQDEYRKNYGVDGTMPVEIIIPGGTYRFDDITNSANWFTENNSGTDVGPITYKAKDGEEVIFKGSKVLDTTAFEVVTDADILAKIPENAQGKVLQLNLADQGITTDMIGEVPENWRYNDYTEKAAIYLDDVEQTIARWPNGENEYSTYTSKSGNSIVVPDSRVSRWGTAEEARLVGFLSTDYTYDRTKISSISGTTINFVGEEVGEDASATKRYAVINLLEELDVPGEYYIDSVNQMLYYYPSGDLTGKTMEISIAKRIINMQGVSNIGFSGITFAQVRDSAVYMNGGTMTNVTFSDCTFENIGRYGLSQTDIFSYSAVGAETSQENEFLEGGNESFKLTDNKFINCGHSAFFLVFGSRDANVPSNSSITGNYIYNIGRNNKKGQAANILGVGVDVANNTVQRTGYGIRFDSADTYIHHNEIFDVMNHLQDGGAIYTGRDFINRNNEIYRNYVHDVYTAENNFAVYLDDMNAGTKVYENILADAWRGVQINTGLNNTVTDNIIVNATDDDGAYIVNMGLYNYGVTTEGAGADIQIFVDNIKGLEDQSGYTRYTDLVSDMTAKSKWAKLYGNTVKNNVGYEASIDNDGSSYITGDSGTEFWNNVAGDNNFGGDVEITDGTLFVDAANGNYILESAMSGTSALSDDVIKIDEFGSKFRMSGNSFNLNYPAADSYVDAGTVEFGWDIPDGADRFTVTVKNAEGTTVATIDTPETYITIDDMVDGTYTYTVTAYNDSVNNLTSWTSDAQTFNVGEEPEPEPLPDTVTTKTIDGDNTVFAVVVNGDTSAATAVVTFVAVYQSGKLLEVAKAVDGKATIATSKLTDATTVKTFVWDLNLANDVMKPLWEAEVQNYSDM